MRRMGASADASVKMQNNDVGEIEKKEYEDVAPSCLRRSSRLHKPTLAIREQLEQSQIASTSTSPRRSSVTAVSPAALGVPAHAGQCQSVCVCGRADVRACVVRIPARHTIQENGSGWPIILKERRAGSLLLWCPGPFHFFTDLATFYQFGDFFSDLATFFPFWLLFFRFAHFISRFPLGVAWRVPKMSRQKRLVFHTF